MAPPEKRDEVLQTFRLLLGPTQVERGCIRCRLYRDVEDENAITYVEQWQTAKDLERHLRSEQYRKLVALIDISSEPPEVQFNTISHTAGLEYLAAVRGLRDY